MSDTNSSNTSGKADSQDQSGHEPLKGNNGGAWTAETHLVHYPVSFNKGMATFMATRFRPDYCLEFGSGMGYLSKYINELANPEAYLCIEPELSGPNYDGEDSPELLNFDIFSDPHPVRIDRKFDLVVSIEVAEHIPRAQHEYLFDFLVSRSSKWIVFSGARIGQGGIGHIAERDEADWKSEFLRRGLVFESQLTDEIRAACDEKNINHKRNVMVFRRPEHYQELDLIEAQAKPYLNEIRDIVVSHNTSLVGNLFYVYLKDAENGMPCESLRIKRDNFLQLVKGKKHGLMIGFNAGHSTLLALLAEPDVKLTIVDLCEFSYVMDCYRYLDRQFPGRLTFIQGNSVAVLPQLTGQQFDFAHLDAGKDKTFTDDINNLQSLLAAEHVLVVDDTQNEGIAAQFEMLSASGVLDSSAYAQYGHKLRNRTWKHAATRVVQDAGEDVTSEILARLGTLFDNEVFPSLYTSRSPQGTIIGADRANSLIHLVKDVTARRLPGDFVECGVAAGHASLIGMMSANRYGNRNMKFYLYDTFQGFNFTLPDENDLHNVSIKEYDLSKYQTVFTSKAEVMKKIGMVNMLDERAICIEGRIEDTLDQGAHGDIAILRLDMDLYEPTVHALELLYPSLMVGGYLIIDDYGHWQGCKDAVDEYFSAHSLDTTDLVRIDYTCYIYQKLCVDEA